MTRTQQPLQNITDKDASGIPEGRIAELTRAFELFSSKTIGLEQAYATLQKRLRKVDLELEKRNIELNDKVVELKFTTSYLHNILEHMAQGILFVGLDGRISTYNPAAQHILRLEAERIIGGSYWDHFSDTYFGFSMREALGGTDTPIQPTHLTVHVAAEEKELDVETSFIHSRDGSAQGIILLIRDVTEVRRLQRLASRNDRMQELGEMAASVAHEIRNPLGGIEGYASLLERDLADIPESRAMARYIIEGTRAMNRLVTDVLHYSRPLQLVIDSINLATLVTDVLALIKMDKRVTSGVEWQWSPPEEEIIVPVDIQLIKAALLNLLVNASQALEGSGTVMIELLLQERTATIAVTDSGKGIPKLELEKIFSPFFTTKKDGSGIGLSEVHKIARAHGGTVEVVSEVGEFTTFSFKIPTTG